MYRTKQAAKYVGMNFNTFVYHVTSGHIKERGRIKGERIFEQHQLDTFKEKYLSVSGMTKEDICAEYGQEEGVVRGYLRRRNIKPMSKNGRSFIYDTRVIRNMAIDLGWIKGTKEKLEASDDLPVGKVEYVDLGGKALSQDLVGDE